MSVKRVTGHGAFAGDLRVPGLLHVRVVRSPHAHARVLRIDASAARALPGVVAVLGQADLPGGAAASAWPPLFDGTVRFVGDRVAVVAAEDPELALRAADAVRVEYEELTPVLDPEAALLFDAIAVHETANPPRNLAARVQATLGDVEHALAEAERVFEATYRVPAAQAAPIEPHLVISWLDEDRRLVVRTSTESPFRVRRTLAQRLDIPAARILVVQPQVGGGFGGKSDVVAEDLCALVTLRTGRPARLAFSREEELTVAPARPAQTVRLRAGLRARRLTALDLRVLVDAGAYPEGSESLLRAAAREALSLYSVPDIRFVGEAVFTHRPPTSPLRGQGVLATLFALESHLDLVADALEEDPLELRRRHLATHEHTLRVAGRLQVPAPAGHFDASEAMAVGARAIGWSGRGKAAAGSGTRRRGVGMALVRHAVVGERGAASLQLREDGSFNLFVGASAMGNGAEGAFAAAAAQALGVPVERVVPAAGDTDSAPLDPGDEAPTLYLTGRAVQAAAARVRSQILEAGARLLGAAAQELVAEDEQVRTRDGRTVGFAMLAAQAFRSAEPIAATALHAAEEASPAGAAVFAEVEVDLETGEVRVLKLVAALEGGPRLDPRLAEADVEGDALRSTGDALFEHMAFTEDGRAVFRSFRDYRIATAADAPEVRTFFVPLDAPQTPFGARPLGDVAATGPALAIANAVAHAIGARVNDLPLGPERVRNAAALNGTLSR
jgi:putative selenate reductase molybdopterin-binding subunit